MPLTNGSGLFGSGSCFFRHRPSRCQQETNLKTKFSAYYFLKVHLHHFSKIESQKESQNSRNPGFSYYFSMMIAGSGSISLTNGSGARSKRPTTISGFGSGSPTLLTRLPNIRDWPWWRTWSGPWTRWTAWGGRGGQGWSPPRTSRAGTAAPTPAPGQHGSAGTSSSAARAAPNQQKHKRHRPG